MVFFFSVFFFTFLQSFTIARKTVSIFSSLFVLTNYCSTRRRHCIYPLVTFFAYAKLLDTLQSSINYQHVIYIYSMCMQTCEFLLTGYFLCIFDTFFLQRCFRGDDRQLDKIKYLNSFLYAHYHVRNKTTSLLTRTRTINCCWIEQCRPICGCNTTSVWEREKKK